jgi:hypothetical protein
VFHLPPRPALAAGLALCLLGLAPLAGRAQEQPKAAEKAPEKAAEKAPEKAAEDAKEVMSKTMQKAEEDYRLYFRRPETAAQFWSAINYEIDVGKFDVAALLIDELLKKQPADKVDRDLAAIEASKGLSPFLRLKGVRRWFANAELEKEAEQNVDRLISRVTAAVEKSLSDPQRLARFIRALGSDVPEERAYGFVQLKRAGERATPYLVDALRQTAGTAEHDRLREDMVRLGADFLPPTYLILVAHDRRDAKQLDPRLDVLYLIRRLGDRRAIPYLWHLTESPLYPPLVRSQARETLASLLSGRVENLPPARLSLTQLAQEYYQHQVKFPNPRRILVWPWDGQQLARQPVALSPAQAEQFFGLLFAKQALDLDPSYRPAQEVFLDLTLQGAFADNLDRATKKRLPDSLQRLLTSVDGDLLIDALDRALTDRNLAVILPLVRVLGERGEYRAGRPPGEGPPQGLLRALYYPDRRVQMAAVQALARMPGLPDPATAARVVEILRRFLAAEPVPRALVVFVPTERAAPVRTALKAAGFDPVLAPRTTEALQQLVATADFDIVLVDSAAPPAEVPFLIGQVRADSNVGLLPIVLLSSAERKQALQGLAGRHTNVWVIPEGLLTKTEELKTRLDEALRLSLAPAVVARLPASQRTWVTSDILKAPGLLLTPADRKQLTAEALELLWNMARGDIRGYDIRPAQSAVVAALRSPELAPQAVEVLGRLAGVEPQQRLAALALDPAQGKLRLPAAGELNRNIRQHGLVLNKVQTGDIQRAVANPKEDAALRGELALVLAHVEPGRRVTGVRLRDYRPEMPAAQGPPPQNPPPQNPPPKKE